MILDPYENQRVILVGYDSEELKKYIRNRISGKSGEPPINYGHGERPEKFLVWAYNETKYKSSETEYKCFKNNFGEASRNILSQLLEQIEQGCPNSGELLSRILYVATKCNITQVFEPLKDKIIQDDELTNFARENLLGVDVTYSTDLLKQSLSAIITFQPSNDLELLGFSSDLWMRMLKKNDLPRFRAIALQGLEKFYGLDAMKLFHYYLEDLADQYQNTDDRYYVVLEAALALNFFFKSKTHDDETLFNRPELLLSNLYDYEFLNAHQKFWTVVQLVKDSISYLLKRNDVFVDENTKGKWEGVKDSLSRLYGNTNDKWKDVVSPLQNDQRIMEYIAINPRCSYSDKDFYLNLGITPSQHFVDFFMKRYFNIEIVDDKKKYYMIRNLQLFPTLKKDTEKLRKILIEEVRKAA